MNKNNGNLELVSEEVVELSEVEQQKLKREEARRIEKEEKKRKEHANTLITRQESFTIAKTVAEDEVGKLAQFLREPLQVSMIQTMAVVELLIEKGIIDSHDDFQVYLERVAKKVVGEEGGASGEEEDKAEGSFTVGDDEGAEEEETR